MRTFGLVPHSKGLFGDLDLEQTGSSEGPCRLIGWNLPANQQQQTRLNSVDLGLQTADGSNCVVGTELPAEALQLHQLTCQPAPCPSTLQPAELRRPQPAGPRCAAGAPPLLSCTAWLPSPALPPTNSSSSWSRAPAPGDKGTTESHVKGGGDEHQQHFLSVCGELRPKEAQQGENKHG